jgi:nitrate/nitrite transport system permease protein
VPLLAILPSSALGVASRHRRHEPRRDSRAGRRLAAGGRLWAEHVAERARARRSTSAGRSATPRSSPPRPDADGAVAPLHGQADLRRPDRTSLKTVFAGFLLATSSRCRSASCAACPHVNAAINPLVQIFRPVSPLAWLPIVTHGRQRALRQSADPMFQKSFLISAITVTLCSLWPTLINTALGVASIDKDLMNVGRVLRLRPGRRRSSRWSCRRRCR